MAEKYSKFHESLSLLCSLKSSLTLIWPIKHIPFLETLTIQIRLSAVLSTAISLPSLFISNIPVQFIFIAYCLVPEIQSQIQFPSVCPSKFSYHTQFVWSLKTVASLKGVSRNSFFFLYQHFARHIVTSNPIELVPSDLLATI